MSSTIPNETDCIELLLDAGCKRRVIIHCCTVEAVAKEIASHIACVDRDLVEAGALLHDIGRSVDHSIMHAYIGSQIVQGHGLPQPLVDDRFARTSRHGKDIECGGHRLFGKEGADRGADRIEALHRELSDLYGEDLDVIPDRIGQYPDLPLARSFDLV